MIGSKPVIIGGCYRSGTTLLRNLLNNHSEVFCGPEVKFFEDFYGTFKNDPMKHKRFFQTIRPLNVPVQRLLKIYGAAYIKTLNIAAKRNNKTRWAEKNPENVIYMREWEILLKGEFYYVFVVRHPLDTLSSLLEIGFNKSLPKGFEGKLKIVKQFIGAGLEYFENNRDSSVMVKYEELVTNPEIAIERLLKNLNLDYESTIINKTFSSSNSKVGIGDPKFKKSTSIHSASIGRWQTDLKKEQRILAIDELSELLQKLKYST